MIIFNFYLPAKLQPSHSPRWGELSSPALRAQLGCATEKERGPTLEFKTASNWCFTLSNQLKAEKINFLSTVDANLNI